MIICSNSFDYNPNTSLYFTVQRQVWFKQLETFPLVRAVHKYRTLAAGRRVAVSIKLDQQSLQCSESSTHKHLDYPNSKQCCIISIKPDDHLLIMVVFSDFYK